MAKKEIDKLYVSIGVDTSDLKVGFEKTDTTINQYVSKLNQQQKNLKLKLDIDLSKLELSGNELDKLRVKAKSLQEQLELAQKKQSISAQTLALNTQKYGAESAITRKSQTIDLYRQRDVVALENELKKVNAELDKLTPKSQSAFNKLGANAKKAAGSMGTLTTSIASLNAKWTAALAVIGTGAGFLNLTESAMKAGEQLYQIQTRLNLTAKEAGQLKKLFAMTDSDLMTLPSFLARLDKSYTQAGESGKAFRETLDAYGVQLTDSNGKLLGTVQQLERLAVGYKNARETGDEEAFSMDVLGARGQQLIPVLDQLAEKMEIVKKTGSTGLLNAQEAHELYQKYQQLQVQIGDLKGVLGKALIPLAEELMPPLIETTKEFCDVINENKDGIRDAIVGWGSVFKTLAETIGGAVTAIGELKQAFDDLDFMKGRTDKEKILEDMYGKGAVSKGRSYASLIGGTIGAVPGFIYGGPMGAAAGAYGGARTANEIYTEVGTLFSRGTEYEKYAERQKYRREQEEQLKKTKEAQKKEKEATKESTEATKENSEAAKQNAKAQKENASAIKERNAATKELRKELTELTSSDYDNKLAVLNKKVEEFKAKGVDSKLLSDYYNASVARLNEDITESVLTPISSAFKSDFQNQLDEIDAQARRYKRQAGSALSDDTLNSWVQRRKSEVTSEWDKQVAEQIDSVWNTEFTNQLNRIEREKQAWIKKGLDEVKATQWAEEQKKQATNNTIKSMFTSQKKYLQLYRNAMNGAITEENGFYDFTSSDQDRRRNAVKAIQRMMMQEAGVSPNERTSMAEIQGFQQVMKEAENWGLSLLGKGSGSESLQINTGILESTNQTNSILSQIYSEVPQINSNLQDLNSTITNTKPPVTKVEDVTEKYKAQYSSNASNNNPSTTEKETKESSTNDSIETSVKELITKLNDVADTIKNSAKEFDTNISSLKESFKSDDNKEIVSAVDNSTSKIVELLTQINNEVPRITANVASLKELPADYSTDNLNNLATGISEGNIRIVDVLTRISDEIPKVNSNIESLKESFSVSNNDETNSLFTNLSELNNRISESLNQVNNEIPKINTNLENLLYAVSHKDDEVNIQSDNELNNNIISVLNQIYGEVPNIVSAVNSLKDVINASRSEVNINTDNENNTRIISLLDNINNEVPNINSNINSLKEIINGSNNETEIINKDDYSNRIVTLLESLNNEVPNIASNINSLKDIINNSRNETEIINKTENDNRVFDVLNNIYAELPNINSSINSLKDIVNNFKIEPIANNGDSSSRIIELLTQTNVSVSEIPQINSSLNNLLNVLQQNSYNETEAGNSSTGETNTRIIELLSQQNIDIPLINTNLMNLLNEIQGGNNSNNNAGFNILSNTIAQSEANISRILNSINSTIPQISLNLSGILERMNRQVNTQPPQINVSPVINVDLGGAYVFDNAMKQELTDDITREVANGVTEAVTEATTQIATGFAR